MRFYIEVCPTNTFILGQFAVFQWLVYPRFLLIRTRGHAHSGNVSKSEHQTSITENIYIIKRRCFFYTFFSNFSQKSIDKQFKKG